MIVPLYEELLDCGIPCHHANVQSANLHVKSWYTSSLFFVLISSTLNINVKNIINTITSKTAVGVYASYACGGVFGLCPQLFLVMFSRHKGLSYRLYFSHILKNYVCTFVELYCYIILKHRKSETISVEENI